MTITHITEFQAVSGQQDTLEQLLIEGQGRMRTADGCQSFDLYRDQNDELSFTFVQSWISSEAHDAAFGERIVETGHLQKVLGALGQPLIQRTYVRVP
jgi:quinol monooxygenase YgiN